MNPLAETLQRVGDRWTLLLVEALLDGPRRFGELQGDLEGIAPNVLSQRLRHLEGQGLAIGRPYQERPPRFEYELTAAGRELEPALRVLADWGASHGDESQPPAHDVCGTPLELRWWCPTCEAAAEPEDGGEVI